MAESATETKTPRSFPLKIVSITSGIQSPTRDLLYIDQFLPYHEAPYPSPCFRDAVSSSIMVPQSLTMVVQVDSWVFVSRCDEEGLWYI